MNSCEENISSKSSQSSWGSRLPTFLPCAPPTPHTSSHYCTHMHVNLAPISSSPKSSGSAIVAGNSAVAMARSGVVLLSPPLVPPVASTSASSIRDCCSCASNAGIIRDVSMLRSFAGKRVAVRLRSSESQRWRPSRASVEEDSNAVSQLNSFEVFGVVINYMNHGCIYSR